MLTTPGLDGLHVGPADLSLGLGLPTFADLTDPELLGALDEVVAAATHHGIVAGVHAPTPNRAVEMAARGFTFVTAASDADLLGRLRTPWLVSTLWELEPLDKQAATGVARSDPRPAPWLTEDRLVSARVACYATVTAIVIPLW